MSAPRVVVAGSINMDIVVRSERHPRPGETVVGSGLDFFPGGKGANQALAAARLGADAVLIGRVGTDDFGSQVIGYLQEGGVDVSGVIRDPDRPTGTGLIVLDAGGENTIVSVHGANDSVSTDDLRGVTLQGADVAVAQVEIPEATVEEFLALARRSGARTVLNVAPARPVGASLLEHADVIVVNEWELAVLAGRGPDFDPTPEAALDAAGDIQARADQTVVVTLGAQGAVVLAPGVVVFQPGRRVPVTDATGAGDCFVGALATRLAASSDIADATQFANVAASVSVQRMGAAPSMPSADDVTAALRGDAG